MSDTALFWPAANPLPALPAGHVHVFAWRLDVPPKPLDWERLGEEETVRARRFVFPRDRDRYVRAHSGMRRVLAEYSGIAVADIRFGSNAYGKPVIEDDETRPVIHFNLSHSGGIAVLGVSRSYPLGIDVELARPIGAEVAEHHFSDRERLTLRGLTPGQWRAGFFRCWTSKEALLKGEGCGLNLPLDAFDVEADPALPPALLAMRSPANISSGWRLVELKPAPAAVAALAVLDETTTFAEENLRCLSLNW